MATLVLQQRSEQAPHLHDTFLKTCRPWLALYGVRLRPGGSAPEKEVKLAPIQLLLPEEMLLSVFAKLPVAALGAVQCVCRQWRAVGGSPCLWRRACLEAFYDTDQLANAKLVRAQYRNCWRTMFLERPHLRFDGLYVSRNTYLRTGVVEWKVKNPVHLVCYFRYYRFMPDGTFLYRTTPETVTKVAKSLMSVPRKQKQQQEHIYQGRFRLNGHKLCTAMRYDSRTTTEIRSRLRLRSTVRGANNRLDVENIVSFDMADGSTAPMIEPGQHEEEEEQQLAGAGVIRMHRRGLAPFVFVPWEAVATSVLNLPVSQMDYFMPG